MNTVERRHLEKLIQFLEKLEPNRFKFSEVISQVDVRGCGSVCCAIGWTPKVFPRLVRWGLSCLRIKQKREFVEQPYHVVAARLFGLSNRLCCNLFCPNCQCMAHEDLPDCGRHSSPQEVAAMLRKFLELVDQKKIEIL